MVSLLNTAKHDIQNEICEKTAVAKNLTPPPFPPEISSDVLYECLLSRKRNLQRMRIAHWISRNTTLMSHVGMRTEAGSGIRRQ